VLVFSRGASRSTRRTKSEPEDSPSQDLRSALASLQADQAELYATLEKLTTTVKRLSSRAGMQELREQRNGHESSGRASGQNPPPTGAPKAELLRVVPGRCTHGLDRQAPTPQGIEGRAESPPHHARAQGRQAPEVRLAGVAEEVPRWQVREEAVMPWKPMSSGSSTSASSSSSRCSRW
jgi:hypothetical protein